MARDQVSNPANDSPNNIGGGLPSAINFDTSVSFTKNAYMPQQLGTTAMAFSPNTDGAKAGASVSLRVVADGSNTPTFSNDFYEHSSSNHFQNSAGVVNFIDMWFDGTNYFYSISQAANLPLVALPIAPFRFINVNGDSGPSSVVESGNSSSGYTYTGAGGTAWQQYATSNKHMPASGDASVRATRGADMDKGSSAMIGLQVNNTPASWDGTGGGPGYKYGVYADTGGLYRQLTDATPAPTTTLALAPTDGDIVRLRRSGTTILAEVSQNGGSSYQTIHQWTNTAAEQLYPVICFPAAGVQMKNVAQTGMVA